MVLYIRGVPKGRDGVNILHMVESVCVYPAAGATEPGLEGGKEPAAEGSCSCRPAVSTRYQAVVGEKGVREAAIARPAPQRWMLSRAFLAPLSNLHFSGDFG
ncbi:hypothetical protein Vafri_8708 [Volvox africanus]|uniref:Uncharacterized protein n=1 Tax=Volvox africanus TaxID=51714 RepID=A0A8J4B4F1_9CHLO|nr:hypothetical protein Vafri_8708 [Volvox africanus]